MRTFIIKARKGTTRWERVRQQVGSKEHIEVIAHSVINAFFISSDFRRDVEVYIVLDSSEDFPRTIRLAGNEGISISGFHEEAVLQLIEHSLKQSQGLQKDKMVQVAPGVQVYGYGFERLISHLILTKTIYLLEHKGADIRTHDFEPNPVFILTDHLVMPQKTLKGLKRQGLKTISLGKKILFASQCIVLLNHEMDLQDI
ncbi:MAG: tRNA (pseudouridine(54)-N(1))-methyltransferase TrmY [Legionella sp.]|nr:tRNA (pseudouridine(54)-N(1))-methyltransferase TrmY [Legionella sp.]